MASDEFRYVTIEDEGVQLVAVGPFIGPGTARHFGKACMPGPEGQRWEVAQLVRPGEYTPGPLARLGFCVIEHESPHQASFFAALLYQVLPAIGIGSCDDYFDGITEESGVYAVRLKKPLPADVLKAFLALSRRALEPEESVT